MFWVAVFFYKDVAPTVLGKYAFHSVLDSLCPTPSDKYARCLKMMMVGYCGLLAKTPR